MAKITYLGEGTHPPPQIEWEGVVFPLDQAVEVDDPAMIKKASANPHFKVEDDKPEPVEPEPAATPADDDEEEEEEKAPHHATRAAHHPPPSRRQAPPSRKKK